MIRLLIIEINLISISIQFTPRSKISVLVIKTDKVRLFREFIVVCSDIQTNHQIRCDGVNKTSSVQSW